MYEDIYKDLTEEERLKMLKADIPKFEVVGEFEMTEEMKKEGEEALFNLIKEFEEDRGKERKQ